MSIPLENWIQRRLTQELQARGIQPRDERQLSTNDWLQICAAAGVPVPPAILISAGGLSVTPNPAAASQHAPAAIADTRR
jgi:glutamate dehydrogenase/leucine dehydrogenase